METNETPRRKRVPPSVRIDHLSEKQTAERMKKGAKTDTQAKKTKNLVSKLHRVHEPKPNLGPTGIPNEQSSLGESSPQKGVHHRRSQMQADALMQQTHPSIPEPEEENQTKKKLQADSVHAYIRHCTVLRAIGYACLTHQSSACQSVKSVSLLESRRPT